MNKTILYVIGGVVVVGAGAFLYMKYKKKPQSDLSTQIGGVGSTTTTTTTGATTTNGATNNVKPAVVNVTPVIPLEAISLRDSIISLKKTILGLPTVLRGKITGKINDNTEKLKTLGYKLDASNNLVKI